MNALRTRILNGEELNSMVQIFFNDRVNQPRFIVNAKSKLSLRGAKRRGNLVRLLHFVRNDIMVISTCL
jgi:hypothetical protein